MKFILKIKLRTKRKNMIKVRKTMGITLKIILMK